MDTTELRVIALVALGGGAGSVARYLVAGLATKGSFPWGTFTVNFSGTFLLATLFFLALDRGYLTADARAFLFIGLFGGFTTLSTFGLETVSLLRDGQLLLAGFNIFLNGGVCVLGGIAGAALGVYLGAG